MCFLYAGDVHDSALVNRLVAWFFLRLSQIAIADGRHHFCAILIYIYEQTFGAFYFYLLACLFYYFTLYRFSVAIGLLHCPTNQAVLAISDLGGFKKVLYAQKSKGGNNANLYPTGVCIP